MALAPYGGPSVFGYETDVLRRVAAISAHSSPLASLGGKDAGGMQVYVRELSCHTARLGLPVDIFTRRTDPDAPEVVAICDGVNVINITAGPAAPVDKNQLFGLMPEFAAQMALYSMREGVRYDVVHAHYWLSGWAAHLVKRYWDTPFIQMFHTTAHMKNAVSPVAQHETPLRAEVEKKLLTLPDSLIAANPDERADLIWRMHTPADKICTIPPGVDTELFQPMDQAAARAELGMPADRKVVLFVGRIDPIKGLDTLLNAATKINRSRNPLFVIVGGDLDANGQPVGPLATVAADAQAAGIADLVLLPGSQPQNRLPLYYAAADVVAVPSRYESFGLVAVEAMACGRPVIASRSGGLVFTIEDEETGLLTQVGDADAFASAIDRMLADDAMRLLMGHQGHLAAQRFSWTAVAQSILHVYRRLAEGHRANLCCAEEIYA